MTLSEEDLRDLAVKTVALATEQGSTEVSSPWTTPTSQAAPIPPGGTTGPPADG